MTPPPGGNKRMSTARALDRAELRIVLKRLVYVLKFEHDTAARQL